MSKVDWKNNIVEMGEKLASEFAPNPKNFRTHPEHQKKAMRASLDESGWIAPVIENIRTGNLIDGHERVEQALANGNAKVPFIRIDVSEQEEGKIIASLDPIGALAEIDQNILADVLADVVSDNQDLWNFLDTLVEVDPDQDGGGSGGSGGGRSSLTLSDKFVVPPFTIFDTRQGYWQDRKKEWLEMGIRSEKGRGMINGGEEAAEAMEIGRAQADTVSNVTNAPAVPEWAKDFKMVNMAVGTSIFDPVLCEILYKWFAFRGAEILDPFAGGSVRGIVASRLGRLYTGIDLSSDQVEENRKQAIEIFGPDEVLISDPDAITPVQQSGGYFFKRDDLFSIGGVRGGKVRTCASLAMKAKDAGGLKGLTTAGSRSSPQVSIVANIAHWLGLPSEGHTPEGELSGDLLQVGKKGMNIIQHKAGYNHVIIKRSRDSAEEKGWLDIPFGMECQEAVEQTRKQVANIPQDAKRLIVPVGSGMSLAGILRGLIDQALDIPVVGVCVGADPKARLDQYAPPTWPDMVELIDPEVDYHKPAAVTEVSGIHLDPHYEAKCIDHLQDGDCLWIVGIRQSAQPKTKPQWIVGDSRDLKQFVTEDYQADFIISCPPYYDLEQYSEDPVDLSNAESYDQFMESYRVIIKWSASMLKENRFACFVVGDIRDKEGNYRNFVSDTISAFRDAGMELYNEAILLNQAGSLPMRIERQFKAGRKLGKSHQNVLIFVKGSGKEATLACGEIDISSV